MTNSLSIYVDHMYIPNAFHFKIALPFFRFVPHICGLRRNIYFAYQMVGPFIHNASDILYNIVLYNARSI